MEILYVLIPVSVLLVLAILAVLGWAVNSGQFEDIEQEGLRVLQPQEQADGQPDERNVEPHQE
ncbi:MAG: cbb3-type cytochrome oxidase assembly protein CcoS [Burkholderiales bacterium]|jgi:cbb3-type cytochrome oxidase maturation protein|nr:MAG: cbb3-type cytochrome oxidase assembly protein CcoS [Burkholderiales bacterium]